MSHHPERTARNVRPVNQPPSLDYDNDVTNAGLGALIISGGTHHWTAKFVKE